MAFKLAFADNSQQPEQITVQKEGSCAEPALADNAKDLINPSRETKIVTREAHANHGSDEGAPKTNSPKRNTGVTKSAPQPANGVKSSNRKKDGVSNQAAVSSVDSCRFTILDLASLPVKAFSNAIRDYERGIGIHNKCVGLLAAHNMLENPTLEGTKAEAKMGEYRDKVIREYFLSQFSNLQHYHAVDTMVDIYPAGSYRKPVRPYHVYHDMFDYLREYPSVVKDFKSVVVTACRATLAYYGCEMSDGEVFVRSLDVKDQKGGKLGDSPKAVAKFQATLKVCANIVNGGEFDATALYDLANRMRLFCPGFAPKDWRSSVK